jgi:hypothetical protein
VSHETLLYVSFNHLNVLISSDAICMFNVIFFCYKDMNSSESLSMHVALCGILYYQSG